MATLLLRKLMALPFALLGVSLLIFLVVHALPGDPARMMAGPEATEAAVDDMRARLGLQRPLLAQYVSFVGGAVVGDFGTSLRSDRPVAQEVASRFPYTIGLALCAYVLAIGLGVPAGLLAGVRHGSWVDGAIMAVAVLGASVATFWMALLLMSLFAVELGWLPLLGAAGWRNYIMPSVVLAALPAALIARMTRAGTVEVLRLDYIRTAWAKGLAPATVYGVHALRNVLAPVVTVVGLNFGSLIGGAVVTESVFNWPGLGRLLVDSVRYRDYPVLQAVTLLAVTGVVLVNTGAELAIVALNPRLRRR